MSAPFIESFTTDGPMNNGQIDTNQSVPEQTSQKETEPPKSSSKSRRPLDNILAFVSVLCALGFIEGISANGLPNINISSIETRYELKSKQVGLIASSGEIGAICLLLFVSFYGGRSHRPRVTAGGGFVMGLGCLFFLLPHIFVGNYNLGGNGGNMSSTVLECDGDQPSDSCSVEEESADYAVSRFFPMFIVGQTLQGIGFTPAFTCGFAYIDDHTTTENAAVYIGMIYALTALGVGVGYVLGGQFLSFWVDIGRVDTSTVPITVSDKRWVGAWWIGYVLSSCLFFVTATIMCFFPRNMPDESISLEDLTADLDSNQENVKTSEENKEEKKTILQLLLSFPKALLELICNPLYVLMVLVGAGDTLIVSGIAGFAPKIIEEKFNVQPSESGLIMGTVTLIGGAGGLGLGGYLIRRFHLKLLGILKMCLIFIIVAGVVGGSCFFINCPSHHFAGVTSTYGMPSSEFHPPLVVGLNAACNSNCSCSTRVFHPVCGEDGVTYFSACYAGCSLDTYGPEANSLIYDNCTCILDTLRFIGQNGTGRAVNGSCHRACSRVWIFSVVLFFGILFTFLIVTPISVAILRCVPECDRSVGLGLQWVTLRVLGTIPGPILTGTLLDSTCRLWQETCYGQGSCWMYDPYTMSLRLFLWWVIVKFFGLSVLTAAYLYYKRMGHAEVDRQEQMYESQEGGGSVSSHRYKMCERKAPLLGPDSSARETIAADIHSTPRRGSMQGGHSLYYESRFDARASLHSIHARRRSESLQLLAHPASPSAEATQKRSTASATGVSLSQVSSHSVDDGKQGENSQKFYQKQHKISAAPGELEVISSQSEASSSFVDKRF